MFANQRPKPQRKKRLVFGFCFLALMVGGVLFLTWKDIYSPIPPFERLREAQANGFRADIAGHVWGLGQYSIEFYDGAGRRYQVGGVEKPEIDQIAAALPTQVPVLIRYGPWRSPWPSTKIFTVYQLEVGQRVIVPYARLATARHKEQSAGPLIIFSTAMVAALSIFIAFRRDAKFRSQLALLRSRD